ncbi:MAG: MobQ family relaxase [Fimbriimonas sp.]
MKGYYHLSVSVIGRGTGRSAVACAAYRSGEALADERYGKIHDYGRRRGIAETGIATPDDAADWMRNRERLWNAVEAAEKRKDAQLAREFVVAFPHEMDAAERRELLETFVREEFTQRGLVADWAIHAPNAAGDERNWHAHIMTTMRTASAEGFAPKKDRSLNDPAQLVQWRESWAAKQNEACARLGIRDANGDIVTVDHRSYDAQGIDLAPTIHLGVHATAMERRGHPTELGDVNRAIREGHQEPRRRQAQHLSPEQREEAFDPEAKRRARLREALDILSQPARKQEHDHTPEP